MIIKKTFVTTTSFFLTAALLSQIYSFKNAKATSINYSAFSNLAQNIKSVSLQAPVASVAPENVVLTSDIIKVIDKEISQKINRTRYSIRVIKAPLKKVQVAVAAKKVKWVSEDLSSYEINNSGLINLYALSVEEMAFLKFESTKLADSYFNKKEIKEVREIREIKKITEIKDEVAVAQASTAYVEPVEVEVEEAPVENYEEPNLEKEEEMVMFDYSDKPAPVEVVKTIDQKLYERPLSKTVQQVITREMGNKPIKKLVSVNTQKELPRTTMQNITQIDNQEIDLNAEENTVYDYSPTNNPEPEAETNAFTAPSKTDASAFILKAKEINLNTQKSRQATGFEFVPDYDRTERSDDQSSGQIAFEYSLSGDMNTQTGVLQSRGMISTRVELNLGGKASFEVPLINEEGMQKLLQKKGLAIEGNLLMLAIDPSIIDTEIDSRFAERFFFDKSFKILSSANSASFVMYAGVKTGNIMIRYLLNNKESAQKIVYVGDGEMYFEDAEFINSNRETFVFTTRNLLGQKRKELIIDGGAISYFNTNITAKKKALNAYDIKIPALASGMRKYLEFKHLKDSIFVGSSNEKEIEIPSNDFIAKVLEMNEISSLKDRCVVQINLSKDVRGILANGKNRSGEMFVEATYLDKDGNFSRENLERADKVFVTGDMEGQFNIRLEYTDGSTEFLKTFCSEGTYLVEQL